MNKIRSIVRSIIYDMDEPFNYSDSKINTLIIHAAKILLTELSLSLEVDILEETISPTPDNDEIILIAYKASCLLANAEYKTYAMSSITVNDGPSTIQMGGIAKELAERYKDICKQYENIKLQYLINNSSGKATTGPIVYENLPSIRGNI